MYRPKEIEQLDCPMRLLIPEYEEYNGVITPIYNKDSGPLFFANFKTFGGTETIVNEKYSIIDTAQIVTWYRPDVKSDCRVVRLTDGAIFEMMNEPEDINGRHQILIFKVKRVKGK